MQEEKRKTILLAIAKTVRRLRGGKSQYILGGEYDISTSILSSLERGLKDPQLTTLFKLARAFNITFAEFANEIQKELPDNFSILDE